VNPDKSQKSRGLYYKTTRRKSEAPAQANAREPISRKMEEIRLKLSNDQNRLFSTPLQASRPARSRSSPPGGSHKEKATQQSSLRSSLPRTDEANATFERKVQFEKDLKKSEERRAQLQRSSATHRARPVEVDANDGPHSQPGSPRPTGQRDHLGRSEAAHRRPEEDSPRKSSPIARFLKRSASISPRSLTRPRAASQSPRTPEATARASLPDKAPHVPRLCNPDLVRRINEQSRSPRKSSLAEAADGGLPPRPERPEEKIQRLKEKNKKLKDETDEWKEEAKKWKQQLGLALARVRQLERERENLSQAVPDTTPGTANQ